MSGTPEDLSLRSEGEGARRWEMYRKKLLVCELGEALVALVALVALGGEIGFYCYG